MERELGEFGQGAQIRQAAQSAESGFADFPAAAHSGAALDVDERIRLMRDGLINYAGPLCSRIVGILLVPFVLRHLGAEAYGLWIVASSLAGLIALFDLGLGWSVMREVAGGARDLDEATVRLVAATNSATVALASVGSVVVVLSGLALTGSLHLSGSLRAAAPLVFGLVAVGFIGDQILYYLTEILQGLRRFDVVNSLSVASSLIRAAGIVIVLGAGGAVISLAACQLAVTATIVAVAAIAIRQVAPSLALRPRLFRLSWIRNHVLFSVTSQLAHALSSMTWSVPSLLIGTILGSQAIVPYHIAQRFPLAAAEVGSSVGDVIMPAASHLGRANGARTAGELLEAGTRWILVLELPLCIVLWIITPALLNAWLGTTPWATATLMRVILMAVLADSLGAAAGNVLWGMGAVRTVLVVRSAAGLGMLTLAIAALPRIGVLGAAGALFTAITAGSLALIAAASRECAISPARLMRSASSGLLMPAAACGGFALVAVQLAGLERWAAVIVVAIASAAIYFTLFYRFGARNEERRLADAAIQSLRGVRDAADRALRPLLRRVSALRSAWYLALALREIIRNGPSRVSRELDAEFAAHNDPWDYGRAAEQLRMQRALEMLGSAIGGARPVRTLEIGCAEGIFTAMLAARCDSLLALDLSPLALARARERNRARMNVSFERWDLLHDPLPTGTFDLVVIMSVLEYVFRPRDLRIARDRLADLLAPGGYLLVSNVRGSQISEVSWWGRHLIRGGKWINIFLGKHPSLHEVSSFTGDFYVHTLLRKV